ncbi:MAG TPA: SDR family oxidoreductase [Pirellulaceae bacterium]|nr:SDR family oxidoreductase [Pirellulaceae bacterium]
MFSRIVEQYRDSVVVVVGTGGIGGEIAKLVAPHVKCLVVADHSVAGLDAVKQLVQDKLASTGRLVTRQLDVRDSRAVGEFAKEIGESCGAPRFLFYTAGILTIEPFVETAPETWERAIDVNLNGAFFCSKAIAELMIPQGRGSILILGSIAGTRARSGSRVNPVYNASKAGISAMVNGTAMQLRRHGIRINCISPGPTDTQMMGVQPSSVHAAVKEITLDGRMNNPSEVAELAVFVAGHGRFTGEDVGLGGGAGLGG